MAGASTGNRPPLRCLASDKSWGCDKNFYTLADVRADLKRHIRPFKCEKCEHTFGKKNHLNRHYSIAVRNENKCGNRRQKKQVIDPGSSEEFINSTSHIRDYFQLKTAFDVWIYRECVENAAITEIQTYASQGLSYDEQPRIPEISSGYNATYASVPSVQHRDPIVQNPHWPWLIPPQSQNSYYNQPPVSTDSQSAFYGSLGGQTYGIPTQDNQYSSPPEAWSSQHTATQCGHYNQAPDGQHNRQYFQNAQSESRNAQVEQRFGQSDYA